VTSETTTMATDGTTRYHRRRLMRRRREIGATSGEQRAHVVRWRRRDGQAHRGVEGTLDSILSGALSPTSWPSVVLATASSPYAVGQSISRREQRSTASRRSGTPIINAVVSTISLSWGGIADRTAISRS